MEVQLISRDHLRILTELRQFEFMKDMETTHLKKLASIASIIEFPKEKIIHEAGDLGKAIYLINEGQVNIEIDVPDHPTVTVLTVGPRQMFGLSSLFPPQRKKGRARVVRTMQAVVIYATDLRSLFRADHDLERAFFERTTRIINERIKATWLQLAQRTVVN
jgi:CRP-like cAMP-binding protein